MLGPLLVIIVQLFHRKVSSTATEAITGIVRSAFLMNVVKGLEVSYEIWLRKRNSRIDTRIGMRIDIFLRLEALLKGNKDYCHT